MITKKEEIKIKKKKTYKTETNWSIAISSNSTYNIPKEITVFNPYRKSRPIIS
jgi:hypothetical protein